MADTATKGLGLTDTDRQRLLDLVKAYGEACVLYGSTLDDLIPRMHQCQGVYAAILDLVDGRL